MNGELWCMPRKSQSGEDYSQALPEWEKELVLRSSHPEKAMDHIDLKKLLGITVPPASVPTEVTRAKLSVDGEGVTFQGNLACNYDKSKPSDIPMLTLDQLRLYARRTWADDQKHISATWDVSLEV
ncbi:hypothetical protein QBC35DRAFT_504897 [Podospora australis]|uniref:Uncharacterized protein n=1 Tax=Podospora australis TaxID=1536484 RepID=A0AAN7AF44_9PEZI|nr:hypothetical protein QBC35DRAFT_504897 [Podospora australis]